MKNVLVIKSSILANNSQSSQLVDYLKSKITANITEYDFGANPLPYYNLDAAAGTRGEPKTEAQQKALELSKEGKVTIIAPDDGYSVTAFTRNLRELNHLYNEGYIKAGEILKNKGYL